MACDIIWEEKGILVKLSGTVTDQEVLMANDLMYGDIRFGTISYQIADYTDATDIQITPFDAKVIGTLDKSSSRWTYSKMKNIVITKDKKFIPIVETYFNEFQGTSWECRIFETLDKAYEWVRSEL
jgi:hypothetical protein